MSALVVVAAAGALTLLLRGLFVLVVPASWLPARLDRSLADAGPVVMAALIGSHLARSGGGAPDVSVAVALLAAAALALRTRRVGTAVAGGMVALWVVTAVV